MVRLKRPLTAISGLQEASNQHHVLGLAPQLVSTIYRRGGSRSPSNDSGARGFEDPSAQQRGAPLSHPQLATNSAVTILITTGIALLNAPVEDGHRSIQAAIIELRMIMRRGSNGESCDIDRNVLIVRFISS